MSWHYNTNPHYEDIIYKIALNAIKQSKRVTCFRFDLSYHLDLQHLQNNVGNIIRFIDSLKAKIKADIKRKSRKYGRNLITSFDYSWVRERGEKNLNEHFHFLLFLSKDVYHSFGDFNQASPKNLNRLIQEAWASALGVHCDYFPGMVHFVGAYHLDEKEYDRTQDYITMKIGREISYLAKTHTKVTGLGNNFGHSQILYV